MIHEIFGKGFVRESEPKGENYKLIINFEDGSEKTLLSTFIKLKNEDSIDEGKNEVSDSLVNVNAEPVVEEEPVVEPVVEAVEAEPVVEAVEAEPVVEAVEAEPVVEAVEAEPVVEAVEAEPVVEAVEAEPVVEAVEAEPVVEAVEAEMSVTTMRSKDRLKKSKQ